MRCVRTSLMLVRLVEWRSLVLVGVLLVADWLLF
jgi:hypothetical protein